MAGPVHYEIHVRRAAPDDWTLSHATEDRRRALDAADDLMRDRQAVAVRVTRETLDPETMEFASAVILTRGAPVLKRSPIVASPPRGPACGTAAVRRAGCAVAARGMQRAVERQ